MALPNGVTTLENGLVASGLPAPAGLIHGESVLDLGAGLRPMPWYKPKDHVCAEPHGPYADRLQAAGYVVWRRTALEMLALSRPGDFDAIYMIDVIEHMTRPHGESALRMAQALEPKQIVVFTPLGFLPQEGDAWGLGGEEWQKHRSGWSPKDFPGWAIETYMGMQFFATWTRL
jgi:hypothetical protein